MGSPSTTRCFTTPVTFARWGEIFLPLNRRGHGRHSRNEGHKDPAYLAGPSPSSPQPRLCSSGEVDTARLFCDEPGQ